MPLTAKQEEIIRPIIQRQAKIVLARQNFWDYCKVLEPEFYQEHRWHMKELCLTLNNFYYGLPLDSTGKIYQNLMINMPPRFGKTRTLVNFTDWVLGKNNSEKVIVGSYNDGTAWDFSRYARDGITKEKLDVDDIVFSDIFPDTRLQDNNASLHKWALAGQHFSYMGVGIGGSVTSKGASVRIVDDLIKSAEDALNENYLRRAWLWLSSTFWSRYDPEAERILTIICMTRWAKDDPCGMLLRERPEDWYVLKFEAMNEETGQMLCEDFLPMHSDGKKIGYTELKHKISEEIFRANYHQEPIDIQGRLYKNFKTYMKLPIDENGNLLFEKIKAYCDTADTGDDYLCLIIYGVYQGMAYVIDVYYTKAGMEETEPETANRLVKWNVNIADIESNSGGRGFARNVKRIISELYKTKKVIVRWFHQSKNKRARIHTQSANVQENVIFPADWRYRWPEFYEHVTNYQREGRAKNDDAEDALTGVVEKMDASGITVLR